MTTTTDTGDIDPRSFLPLTPLAFQVLLALADTERHGYGIIREVGERTDGMVKLRTGTLYTMLQRLTEERLIESAPDDAVRNVESSDSRRRYYRLTPLGRGVLTAEARRLESLVGEAHRKHVLGRTTKA
jgi:DNA-binding PadR family transcriptional regulator